MTVTATGIAGYCLGCGAALHENEYTTVYFSDGEAPPWALYCKDKCEPVAENEGKEEGRVTLPDVPMMVARHYAALVPFVDRDLVCDLTRDYHARLLSIATVGNLPAQPTESENDNDDDEWISVHDTMPALGEKVLIWLSAGGGVAFGKCLEGARAGEVEWYREARIYATITHWQPLPGKPKGLQ